MFFNCKKMEEKETVKKCETTWDNYLFFRDAHPIYLLRNIRQIEGSNILSEVSIVLNNNLVIPEIPRDIKFDRFIRIKNWGKRGSPSRGFKSIGYAFVSRLNAQYINGELLTGRFVFTHGKSIRIYFILEEDIDEFIDFYFPPEDRIVQQITNEGDKLNIIFGTQTKACRR